MFDIATGIIGAPDSIANRAIPVRPLYKRPSGDLVPSGYIPKQFPSASTFNPVISAASDRRPPDLSTGT